MRNGLILLWPGARRGLLEESRASSAARAAATGYYNSGPGAPARAAAGGAAPGRRWNGRCTGSSCGRSARRRPRAIFRVPPPLGDGAPTPPGSELPVVAIPPAAAEPVGPARSGLLSGGVFMPNLALKDLRGFRILRRRDGADRDAALGPAAVQLTSFGPTTANQAPCGSWATAMKAPPGTSIGPCATLPPASLIRPSPR